MPANCLARHCLEQQYDTAAEFLHSHSLCQLGLGHACRLSVPTNGSWTWPALGVPSQFGAHIVVAGPEGARVVVAHVAVPQKLRNVPRRCRLM